LYLVCYISIGARPKEGKATVSLNVVKTGLTGRTVLLSPDEVEPYQTVLREYKKALVQSIVDCRWRLDRIPGLEMAFVTLIRNEWISRDPKRGTPRLSASEEASKVARWEGRRCETEELIERQCQCAKHEARHDLAPLKSMVRPLNSSFRRALSCSKMAFLEALLCSSLKGVDPA
jgi:hypothetical protein